MAVSKRVSKLALHFESTILHDMRDEDVQSAMITRGRCGASRSPAK